MRDYILMYFIAFMLMLLSCKGENKSNIPVVILTEQHKIRSFELPKKLNEISGLAIDEDDKIFAHNDEKSNIYQIDLDKEKISKEFQVGDKTIKEDFEGITIVNNTFYMVSSKGDIYEFSEGKDDEEVKFEKYKTFLDSDNDVEGLCYDPEHHSLLLACKGDPGKKYKGNRSVYEFDLKKKKLIDKPRFLLPVKEIMSGYNSDAISKIGEFFLLKDDTFAPSGIEYNQKSGTFFILSFKGRMIVEVSKKGKIKQIYLLDANFHRQPEGITFTEDNRLIISDEAAGKDAKITIYKLP